MLQSLKYAVSSKIQLSWYKKVQGNVSVITFLWIKQNSCPFITAYFYQQWTLICFYRKYVKTGVINHFEYNYRLYTIWLKSMNLIFMTSLEMKHLDGQSMKFYIPINIDWQYVKWCTYKNDSCLLYFTLSTLQQGKYYHMNITITYIYENMMLSNSKVGKLSC